MPESIQETQRLKVLIVDDEPLLAQLLRITLEMKGYTVLPAAHTGEDALITAQTEHPDVAIVDVRLHNDDGITVAEQIRHSTGASIIFTTGSSCLSDQRRMREFHPHACLLKPVSPDKLLALLGEL